MRIRPVPASLLPEELERGMQERWRPVQVPECLLQGRRAGETWSEALSSLVTAAGPGGSGEKGPGELFPAPHRKPVVSGLEAPGLPTFK